MATKAEMLGVPGPTRDGILGTATSSLASAGTGQSDATLLIDDISVISTAPNGAGVRLRGDLQVGDTQIVANFGTDVVCVFPPTGGCINKYPANTQCCLMPGRVATFTCVSNAASGYKFIVQ